MSLPPDSGNIKVVVRCRPLNSREKSRGATHLIDVVDQHQLMLNPPGDSDTRENAKATKKRAMPFSFDRSFDENTEQHELFDYIGVELLEHAFNGFNTCVFAYGQTGSGKSHSMVGYADQKGLVPLTCSKLFEDIREKTAAEPHLKVSVEVSYMEIYNEKVRDLLNPKNKGNLKVREHPSLGPYVEDLSKLVVADFDGIESLMSEGNKARTVAATNMNETSSRSHAVITLVMTQRKFDPDTKLEAEKVSRISLVDLAGSERANATGATGARLKEGANINKSLTTLGKVIAALAQASAEPAKGQKRKALDSFVPYRDSVLTWLLKDSIGGNSKTAMIAAISPADYEETLSTLRYADQAKKIKNKAVVNEDPNARLIRELKEELEMLRTRVQMGGTAESGWDPSVPPEKQLIRYQTKSGEIKTVSRAELQDQMEQNEKLMSSLKESWEEKLAKTEAIQRERELALEELGISVDKGHVGVHAPKKLPHLVNLNEDPLMSECLIYQLRPGETLVGSLDAGNSAQIRLSGARVMREHCVFANEDGKVRLRAMPNSSVMVNGKRVSAEEPAELRSGFRVILGDFHVFRFNNPEEVRRARDRLSSTLISSTGEENNETLSGEAQQQRPESPVSFEEGGDVDWSYARREAAAAILQGQNVDLEKLAEEDLDRLFEDVSRARLKRAGFRPGSRLSYLDDSMSESASSNTRPTSVQYSVFTDDSSMDQWSNEWDSVPSNGPRPGMGADVEDLYVPDILKETETLKSKVRQYEAELAQHRRTASREDQTPVRYTERQEALLRISLAKWRSHRTAKLAEAVLAHASLVKEANVISREMGKGAVYQITVVDEEPLSALVTSEVIAGLEEFEELSDPALAASPKPCAAIKVLDYAHSTAYTWSIAKLQERLVKMRNLYTFVDRPEYSRHFNFADPFFEASTASYIFIGQALIPLAALSRKESSRFTMPILHKFTNTLQGTCQISLRSIDLASAAELSDEDSSSDEDTDVRSQRADRLGVSLTIEDVRDLPWQHFTAAHLQVRHRTFSGDDSDTQAYASAPVEIQDAASQARLKLRKAFTIELTHGASQYLRSGHAVVELYGKVTTEFLQHVDHSDQHGRVSQAGPGGLSDVSTGRTLPEQSTRASRIAEVQMRHEEHHDVSAHVQICELGSSGKYEPVQVRCQSNLDPGSFFLRQGSQRKLQITLQSDSGRQLPWTGVRALCLGNIRLLDSKGRLHQSNAEELLQLQCPHRQQDVVFPDDGTGRLTCWAWWDSSMHDSIFLSRLSPSGQRTLLQLSIQLDVTSCASPVVLDMDIACTVNARDAKPPGRLYSLIEATATGARVRPSCSALFAVRLMPPMTKTAGDLWRLDTSDKYVRGQEGLQGWRPRSISVVRDFVSARKRQHLQGQTAAMRAFLASSSGKHAEPGRHSHPDHAEQTLRSIVSYWQQQTSRSTALRKYERDHVSNEPASIPAGEDAERRGADHAQAPKLESRVSLVPKSDKYAKKGWLSLAADASSSEGWARKWFVLRRPYLFVYEAADELDQAYVMNLTSCRVEHAVELDALLKRKHVFCLYTAANSWVLQAASEDDLQQWLRALDAFAASR